MAGGVFVVFLILVAIFAPLIVKVLGDPPTSSTRTSSTRARRAPQGRLGRHELAPPAGRRAGQRPRHLQPHRLRLPGLAAGRDPAPRCSPWSSAPCWASSPGFFGGWVDAVISRMMDIFLAFPLLLFAIAWSASLPDKAFGLCGLPLRIGVLIFVIGFFNWPYIGRIVRGQTISLREREYVEAARSLGARGPFILFKELLPNLVAPILVYSTLLIPTNILFEAALSLPRRRHPAAARRPGAACSPTRSTYYTRTRSSCSGPGLAIFITVLAFNLFGDGLRDALDPRGAGDHRRQPADLRHSPRTIRDGRYLRWTRMRRRAVLAVVARPGARAAAPAAAAATAPTTAATAAPPTPRQQGIDASSTRPTRRAAPSRWRSEAAATRSTRATPTTATGGTSPAVRPALMTFKPAPGKARHSSWCRDLATGLGKSTDGGKTWTYTSEGREVRGRHADHLEGRQVRHRALHRPGRSAQRPDVLRRPARTGPKGYKGPYKDQEPEHSTRPSRRRTTDDRLPPQEAVRRLRLPGHAPADRPGAEGQGHRREVHAAHRSPPALQVRQLPRTARASPWSATRTGTRRPTRSARRCRTRSTSSSTSTPTTSTTGSISGDLDVDIAGTGVQPAGAAQVLSRPDAARRGSTTRSRRDSGTPASTRRSTPFDNIDCRKAVEYAHEPARR